MPTSYKPFYRIVLLLMLLPFAGIGQSTSIPTWAVAIGGQGGTCITTDFKIDSNNDIYITGTFGGTVDFDPSFNVKNLESIAYIDAFVAKYSAAGDLLWVDAFRGMGSEAVYGIAIDGNNNIAITGRFEINLDVDPGAGTTMLNNNDGLYDCFVVNVDSNGNFLWARTITGSDINSGQSIAIDKLGSRIIAGWFKTDAHAGTINHTLTSGQAGLLTKFDAVGNLQWSIALGQSGNDNSLFDVETDANNNIIVSGSLEGTINFNPRGTAFNLTASGSATAFVAKYNPNGELLWVRPIEGNDTNNIVVDATNGAVYVTGAMAASTVRFAPGQTLSTARLQNVFIARYEADGTFAWATQIGGPDATIEARNINVKNNEVYVVGRFTGAVDFDGSATESIKNDNEKADLFIVKYSTAGGYQWAVNTGSRTCNGAVGGGIDIDSNGDILLSGSFCETMNFDVSDCTTNDISSKGIIDGFLVKYSSALIAQSPLKLNKLITTGATTFCVSGDPEVISGNSLPGAIFQWQMSTDGINYSVIADATSSDYNPPVLIKTTYYKRIAIPAGCTAPQISKVIPMYVSQPLANNTILPTNMEVCTGSQTLVNGSVPTGGGGNSYNYQWQHSSDGVNFNNIAGATDQNYIPQEDPLPVYYKRVVTNTVCNVPLESNISRVTFIQQSALNVTSLGSTLICAGNSVTLYATGATTYKWMPAAGLSADNVASPVASPLVTTVYTVTAFNGICQAFKTITVTVTPKPVANAGTDVDILKGNTIKLKGSITADPNVTYSWLPVTYLDDPTLLEPTATPLTNITYTLTAKSDCFTVSDDVAVFVHPELIISNTFTPNGDGINDNWDIEALKSYPKCEVNIFSKNGAKVFGSVGYAKPWDGRYNGRMLPFGTYYYTVDLKNDSKIRAGWIAIIK